MSHLLCEFAYLKVLETALIDSEELGTFYECFANRSIRRGLDIFLDFVRSGHTETDTYLRALVEEDSYRITFHQFFKSVVRGDYAYYSEVNSRLPNGYQLDGRAHRSHFHRLNLLRYLYTNRKFRNALGEGFINLSVILDLYRNTGLSDDSVRGLLDYALQMELIESDTRKRKYEDDTRALRVTVLGGQVAQKLFKRWEYLEVCMLDTRIIDSNLKQMLLRTYPETGRVFMPERIKAVKAWVQYLQREEERELSGRKGCHIFGLEPIGPELQKAVDLSEERMARSAARQRYRK